MQVNDFLVEQFPNIVAHHVHLDDGKMSSMKSPTENGKWVPTIREFYAPLASDIKEKCNKPKKRKRARSSRPTRSATNAAVRWWSNAARFGKFIACSNFPECKNIFKEPKSTAPVEKAEGRCPLDGGELIYRVGRFGKFIACANFPKCKHTAKIAKEKKPETEEPAEPKEEPVENSEA